jgi:hypothetical protein
MYPHERTTAILPPPPPPSPDRKLANRLMALASDVRAGRMTESERAVIERAAKFARDGRAQGHGATVSPRGRCNTLVGLAPCDALDAVETQLASPQALERIAEVEADTERRALAMKWMHAHYARRIRAIAEQTSS